MNASGPSVSSSAKASARASTGRESALPALVSPKLTSASASATAGSARPSGLHARAQRGLAGDPLGQPLHQEGPGGATIAIHSSPSDVAVLHVAQLVRHHAAHLVGREVLDQVVVEHHPLGVPEAAHVGVDRGGAPAGVHAVDLPHVHAGAVGQPQHVGPQRALGQRLELVEQGVDDHRREVQREHGEGHHHARRRDPPAAREAPDQPEHQRARRAPRRPRRCRPTSPRPPATGPATGWRGPRPRPARGARASAAGRPPPATSEIAPAARRAARPPLQSACGGGRPRQQRQRARRTGPARPATSTRWSSRKSAARSNSAGLK